MYTGKSCAEFNVLASIPFGSEYPLGDCARCRLQTNALLTLKLGARTRQRSYAVLAPSFMVRAAFVCNRQRAQPQEVYTFQKYGTRS